MPTTTALVNLTHPDSGKTVAAGEEITLGDDDYATLRADGKVAASAQEWKANQVTANAAGVYNARTGREDTPAAKADAPLPGPSAPTKDKEKK